MLMSPYTDPCQPKKPRTRPASSTHVFRPYDLLDADHIAAYKAYKRNVTGEIRDVDLPLPIGVTWFYRLETNFMELEESHIDAYLQILRKHQRAFHNVYS